MMDSPCSSYHAKRDVLIYFILTAVATGTLFIYVNSVSQFDKLRLRIDDLEKQLSTNIGECSCKNVSLVCKKGERGPRGSAGPRGFKGDSGSKGDRGVSGQKEQTGPPGAIGQKGQKGDRGEPGTLLEKPHILIQLQASVTKIESDNMTLFCEASGNPPPNIRWEFDSQIVNSRYTFPLKGGLLIAIVSKGDEGRIRCIAESVLGKDVSKTKLIVHTLPTVIWPSKALTATDGIQFQAVCRADGKPTPVLKWKRQVGNLTTRQLLSKDRTNLTLIIERPVLSDAGLYVCEATNYIGRSEKSLLLQVSTPKDCSSFNGNRNSGIYTINPDGKHPFRAFCDMQTSSGGWTVIQRRIDGSVDFFKNWVDYKLGFGNVHKEFWLGNEKIHRLTKRRNMMIRFDLEDVNGNKVYAEYKMFYIDGEDANYKVHVSTYSGTADSFSNTNGMQFGTIDRDNDRYPEGSCASVYHGAWWYGICLI